MKNVKDVITSSSQQQTENLKMDKVYLLNSKEGIEDKLICQKSLKKEEIMKWMHLIDQDYRVEFSVGNLMIQDIVGRFYDGQYQVKNRITFNMYFSNNSELISANITSNNEDFIYINSQDNEIEVSYYITVKINQQNEQIFFHDHSVKWNLLIFKSIIILILVIIASQTLRKSIQSEYSNIPDEENEIEPQGWKAIKIESLMPPINRIVFTGLLGTGIHFLITILICLILGSLEMFETHKGSIYSSGIIIYCFGGSINGYYTGKTYKFFGGKSWLLNLFIATVLFPISGISILFIIDLLQFLFGSTLNYSFTSLFYVGLILTVVYLPLTLMGGIAGCLSARGGLMKKRLKKKLLIQNQYFLQKGCLYGIIPFISIIMELYYLLESIWNDQQFEQYTLLIFSFIQLIIIVGCLSVIQTYKQLDQGNYNWHWISFINGGACILYIFGFIFLYYWFVNAQGFFLFLFYFSQNILACFALWMMLGFVSYWISLKFVIYIYLQNKIF